MGLKEDAEANRLKLIEQLYDQWHGYYQVYEFVAVAYEPRSILSKQEAIDWKNPDPNLYTLAVVHPYRSKP